MTKPTCKQCGGTGRIELFSSTVACDCQASGFNFKALSDGMAEDLEREGRKLPFGLDPRVGQPKGLGSLPAPIVEQDITVDIEVDEITHDEVELLFNGTGTLQSVPFTTSKGVRGNVNVRLPPGRFVDWNELLRRVEKLRPEIEAAINQHRDSNGPAGDIEVTIHNLDETENVCLPPVAPEPHELDAMRKIVLAEDDHKRYMEFVRGNHTVVSMADGSHGEFTEPWDKERKREFWEHVRESAQAPKDNELIRELPRDLRHLIAEFVRKSSSEILRKELVKLLAAL